MNIVISRAKLLFLAMLLLTTGFLYGQQKEWQSWNSVGLKIPVSKKVDFKLSELASFSPSNAYALNFAQTSAAFSVDITRQLSFKLGNQLNYIPGWKRRLN